MKPRDFILGWSAPKLEPEDWSGLAGLPGRPFAIYKEEEEREVLSGLEGCVAGWISESE
jgi:hypothetical protein